MACNCKQQQGLHCYKKLLELPFIRSYRWNTLLDWRVTKYIIFRLKLCLNSFPMSPVDDRLGYRYLNVIPFRSNGHEIVPKCIKNIAFCHRVILQLSRGGCNICNPYAVRRLTSIEISLTQRTGFKIYAPGLAIFTISGLLLLVSLCLQNTCRFAASKCYNVHLFIDRTKHRPKWKIGLDKRAVVLYNVLQFFQTNSADTDDILFIQLD